MTSTSIVVSFHRYCIQNYEPGINLQKNEKKGLRNILILGKKESDGKAEGCKITEIGPFYNTSLIFLALKVGKRWQNSVLGIYTDCLLFKE